MAMDGNGRDFFEGYQNSFESDHESSASTCTSYLGVKQECHAPGLQAVPTDDPAVKYAEDFALMSIQGRCNFLAQFELLEIIDVKAEVTEELARFHMLLKVKNENNEEKYKVEVHKNVKGKLFLNSLEPNFSCSSSRI
ncbi:hypothetical protein C5167_047957 [Papaver somniferum]|uniref:Uncharacterized protein n=1 Tax=Papaver somniferum TaxID=3469 RepID=A0A4Y7KJW2_PAPSO|nr:cysteine proteinase inhibitor 12-like [Papaver somniferum]RZC72481.1 hypothetical protein C5167_047957 [Papaver somniferum]